MAFMLSLWPIMLCLAGKTLSIQLDCVVYIYTHVKDVRLIMVVLLLEPTQPTEPRCDHPQCFILEKLMTKSDEKGKLS